MNRPLPSRLRLAATGLAARFGLADPPSPRLDASLRATLGRGGWQYRALDAITADLEDGAEVIGVTLVAKCRDGFTVAFGMEPGDERPEQVIVSEVTASVGGEEVAALMFTSAEAPDSPEGLAEPC